MGGFGGGFGKVLVGFGEVLGGVLGGFGEDFGGTKPLEYLIKNLYKLNKTYTNLKKVITFLWPCDHS